MRQLLQNGLDWGSSCGTGRESGAARENRTFPRSIPQEGRNEIIILWGRRSGKQRWRPWSAGGNGAIDLPQRLDPLAARPTCSLPSLERLDTRCGYRTMLPRIQGSAGRSRKVWFAHHIRLRMRHHGSESGHHCVSAGCKACFGTMTARSCPAEYCRLLQSIAHNAGAPRPRQRPRTHGR